MAPVLSLHVLVVGLHGEFQQGLQPLLPRCGVSSHRSSSPQAACTLCFLSRVFPAGAQDPVWAGTILRRSVRAGASERTPARPVPRPRHLPTWRRGGLRCPRRALCHRTRAVLVMQQRRVRVLSRETLYISMFVCIRVCPVSAAFPLFLLRRRGTCCVSCNACGRHVFGLVCVCVCVHVPVSSSMV